MDGFLDELEAKRYLRDTELSKLIRTSKYDHGNPRQALQRPDIELEGHQSVEEPQDQDEQSIENDMRDKDAGKFAIVKGAWWWPISPTETVRLYSQLKTRCTNSPNS